MRKRPEKNKPQELDHIVLIVFTTPPKYFSNRIGCILSKKLIKPVKETRTIPPTIKSSDNKSQTNCIPVHWSIGRKKG